jgi:hypothetical protein
MIARGSAVNRANIILIDVNEASLAEAKKDLEVISAQSGASPVKVLTCVLSAYGRKNHH